MWGWAPPVPTSAIVHAGYDPEPGTKMARFNVQGSNMMEQLCQDLSGSLSAQRFYGNCF